MKKILLANGVAIIMPEEKFDSIKDNIQKSLRSETAIPNDVGLIDIISILNTIEDNSNKKAQVQDEQKMFEVSLAKECIINIKADTIDDALDYVQSMSQEDILKGCQRFSPWMVTGAKSAELRKGA